MTAYAPRHALTVPREPRRPSLYRRARRLLLSLLPARKPVPHTALLMPPDRFACCGCCTDGSPCEPRDDHPTPCQDGCNDPAWLRPNTLTDAEIAALRPVYAVRHDGLVTVSGTGEVEVYPSPLAWQGSATVTAAQPVLDEEAAELARAERIREQLPECDGRPDAETLQRVIDGLRAVPEQGDYGVKPQLEAERLARVMLP